MAIEIRHATADDEAFVAALITRFLAEEGFGTDPVVVARRTPVFLTTAENTALLATIDGRKYAAVVVTPEGEAAHGFVGWYARFGLVDRGRRLLDRELDARP
jgi:hypothetical protein